MTEKTSAEAVVKPKASRRPARQLVPRQANAVTSVAAEAAGVASEPEKQPAAKPAPKIRKPTREDEALARHQKSLVEALEMAKSIKYDSPQIVRQVPGKAKAGKSRKPKLVRDSFTMPQTEYAQITDLKKRLARLGTDFKKSELLRAGIALLAALNDAELKAVMGRLERLRTGRPN